MLQYLIVLLDNTATSYCHYNVPKVESHLISIDNLKKGILFAMKENLSIQFVYPESPLPEEYDAVIESIDHVKIKPAAAALRSYADIVVFQSFEELSSFPLKTDKSCVLRISKNDLFDKAQAVGDILGRISRLNIVITDIEVFTEDDFIKYKSFLEALEQRVEALFVNGESPQINLLTDRLILDKMNNCNAGQTNITLAPDGRFYVCPAFFYERVDNKYMGLGGPAESPNSVGDLDRELDIKNPQLYRLDHAPLCRICDAFQCKRCVWLNKRLTREINTPSHEQCVTAHLERNASRELLYDIRQHGTFLPEQEIQDISYLDPFDVKEEW